MGVPASRGPRSGTFGSFTEGLVGGGGIKDRGGRGIRGGQESGGYRFRRTRALPMEHGLDGVAGAGRKWRNPN